MRQVRKILIELKTGKKYFVKDEDEFHTSSGVVNVSQNGPVSSEKGTKFMVIEPSFKDMWDNLQKGPAIVIEKDIGLILAKTGVGKNSCVVDAGGGSGSLCLSLANVCKEVTVYEINPEHLKVIQKNIVAFGIDNISLKQDNVYDGIEETEIDLLTLDLPEPWRVNFDCLKLGGFLAVYLPNLTQVKRFIDSAPITVLETVEVIERKWKIEGPVMRPEHQMLGHTAFLVFCRKL